MQKIFKALRHQHNPSMDGWLLEMWVFACLRRGGIKLFSEEGGNVNWVSGTEEITTYDTNAGELTPPEGWLKPKEKKPAYDAVYIEYDPTYKPRKGEALRMYERR